jgi:photosystem II stability/assembly factor-like uncharacterized protein
MKIPKRSIYIFLFSIISTNLIYAQEGWFPQSNGFPGVIADAYFLNDSVGWTAGEAGRIYKTTDGGLNWSLQNSGYHGPLGGIFFLNAEIGWVVGFDAKIVNTLNGGILWTTQNSGSEFLDDVYFKDSNSGWASGMNGLFLKTTDSGQM